MRSVTAQNRQRQCLNSCMVSFAILALHTGTEAGECRQGEESATKHCALPDELGNFQGYYLCSNDVMIGKPRDKEDLGSLVGHFSHVKGVGVGHSWWGEQFCSGNDSDSINIVTTELQTTLDLILAPVYYNSSAPAPPDYAVQVDEQKKTVTAASGVPQRILLNVLAEYISESAPDGYTIAAFPWYIDQSIGGAVSTGTHGSSFQHGSISSQTVRIEMALANGTLVNFTRDADPFLWNAAQIAVGRLGVITEVELSIMPQDMVERVTFETSFEEFVDKMRELQDDYREAVNGTGSRTVADVLSDYEGTQLFWFVPTNKTAWLTYAGLEKEAALALKQQDETEPMVETESIGFDPPTPAIGIESYSEDDKAPKLAPGPYLDYAVSQAPSPALGKLLLPATNPALWNNLQYGFLKTFLTNGTFTRRDSILAETDFVNRATSDTDPYDQYEFSIKIEDIGTCFEKVEAAMNEEDLFGGFPVPPLIRFVGDEEAFLSNANGGPRIFLNIEDHQSYQTGESNLKFDALVEVLRSEGCWARMHWGKAGWPKWAPCFDGSMEYPESWCDFGCAVQALDPMSKFASQSNVWSWNAQRGDIRVAFDECCTPNGFSPSCTCATRTDCA